MLQPEAIKSFSLTIVPIVNPEYKGVTNPNRDKKKRERKQWTFFF